jgi:hypothetical protein
MDSDFHTKDLSVTATSFWNYSSVVLIRCRPVARSIIFHETLSLAIQQETSFPRRASRDEVAKSVDASGMIFDKTRVLPWRTCSGGHGKAISSGTFGRCGRKVGLATNSCTKNGISGENVMCTYRWQSDVCNLFPHDQADGERTIQS